MILLLDELQAVGVAFVSLAEGIDATTPAGRLQLHVLGAIAEFERAPSLNVYGRVWRGPERKVSGWADHIGRYPRNAWPICNSWE